MERFPEDWSRALVVVAHPDDPEYGMAAAVSRWTREGRRVEYLLASSGEAGIEGMPPEQCGPVREDEQRRSAARVGVDRVDFLGFPDSAIENSPELREALTRELVDRQPELVIGLYRGPEWGPGMPNQPDHVNCGEALLEAVGALAPEVRPRWFFESSPQPTHAVEVEQEDLDRAVDSLSEHSEYLSVLDPGTPVRQQAQKQIDRVTMRPDGRPAIGFQHVEI